MPRLKSLAGFRMLRIYVRNWMTALFVYLGLISTAEIKFRDGDSCGISKTNYATFYEHLYRKYNESNGFHYVDSEAISPNGIKLQLPGLPYSHVLDEVFIMKCYGEPNLKNRVAVDIGASIGDTSLFFNSLGAEVYAFEPDKHRFRIALENVTNNGANENIHVMNQYANSKLIFDLIATKSLKNIFMKIDCEGCELEIINDLPDNSFQSIAEIVLESHDNNSSKIIERLNALGFKTRKSHEIISAIRNCNEKHI